LDKISQECFRDALDCPCLIFNLQSHFLELLSQNVLAFVHWGDFVELMDWRCEDAVGAEQPVLGLAEDRNHTVVFQTTNGTT
jgi:hypothetical protein